MMSYKLHNRLTINHLNEIKAAFTAISALAFLRRRSSQISVIFKLFTIILRGVTAKQAVLRLHRILKWSLNEVLPRFCSYAAIKTLKHLYRFVKHLYRFLKHLYRFVKHLYRFVKHLYRFVKRLYRFVKRLYRFAKRLYRFARKS